MSADVIPFPDLLKLDYAEIPGECEIIVLPVVRIDRGPEKAESQKPHKTPASSPTLQELMTGQYIPSDQEINLIRKAFGLPPLPSRETRRPKP